MKLLFIPSWYPNENQIFAGSFIQDLAEDLANRGIEVDVVIVDLNRHHSFKLKSIKQTKAKLREFHIQKWFPPKKNPILQDWWVRRSVQLIESHVDVNQYDFVHSHGYIASFVGDRIAAKNQIQHIVSCHHSDFLTNKIPKWRIQRLQKIKSRSEFIAVSHALKEAIELQLGGSSVHLIPNYFRSISKNLQAFSSEALRCISVMSFTDVKNPHLLLDVFQNLPDHIEVDIVGDGPLKSEIEERIRKHGLGTRVQIIDPMQKSILVERYQLYDLFVSTSRYETFGLSMLESIAAGTPVITTAKGGVRDFINSDNGMMVSPESLQKAILAFDQEKNERYIRQQVSDSVQDYQVNKVMDQYLDFYKKLSSKITDASS